MSTDVSDRIMRRLAETLDDDAFAAMFSPEGLAPQQTWKCEDGWLVSYTTKRIRGGTLAGLFACFVYAPKGRGARTGKAQRWERVRLDRCDTRREARARATAVYYEHSPKASVRHGWNGSGYGS